MNNPLARYRKHPLFYPIVFAVLLHVVVIAVAMIIRMPGLAAIAEKTAKIFHIGSIDVRPRPSLKQGVVNTRQFVDSLKFVNEAKALASSPMKDVPVEKLVEQKSPVNQFSEEVVSKSTKNVESSIVTSQDLQSLLVQTEERQIKDKVPAKETPTTTFLSKISRKLAQDNKQEGSGLMTSLEKTAGEVSFQVPRNLSLNPEEGMPGFTPSSGEGTRPSFSNVELGEGIAEQKKEITKFESLDELLDIEVYTYKDYPTGEKYYMIKIFAKKGKDTLKVMPKEILFTVDASLSISPDRLEEFKNGIRYCLTHLNEGDTFNIVAFKDTVSYFSPHSVSATPEMIKQAEKFIASLSASERTDVYSAFQSIVEQPLNRVPSNVILISDGRPTHGVVNSRDLINSVTRLNKKVRPIFAFSGGAKVNRYLLDFVAYQNRGWSQFVQDTRNIDTGLAEFYEKIKDPLFLNLRYRLNGLEEKEVFPKWLPDFYKNAEFTLYGTYKDEDPFSMQLLGDIDGKTKELVFTRSLKEAKPGTAEIMRGYGFNKIYHLISRMTAEGVTSETKQAIETLSRRYGITTPYSPELEKTD